jgi:hypothetical protein
MSGTTSVPSPTLGPNGFIAPAQADILAGVKADLNSAFGGNLSFGTVAGSTVNATPQAQLASSFTAIVGDKDEQFLLLTQNVDPAYSTGRMQDAIARIYFITRNPAQPTTVSCLCGGIVNIPIPTGATAKSSDGNVYRCTAGGTIGANGFVTLPFACTVTGPIACPAGSLNTVYQQINGWDTINNPTDGVIGNNVESPKEFELRRQASVAKNSVGSIPAVQGAVLNVPNLLDAYTTDNSSSDNVVSDGVTIPPGSLYVCVAGGDPNAVAYAIWTKKTPGCKMVGNTTVVVQDTNSGYSPPYPSYNITFQTAAAQTFIFIVTLTNSAQVPSNVVTQVQAVVLAAFAGSDGGPRARIASTLYASRFYSGVAALGTWVEIVSIKIGSTGAPKATFTASISGSVMTVTAISQGVIGVKQTLEGANIAPNIQILSFGTGSGGTGTYNLTLTQGTIASQTFQTVLADLDTAQVGIAHVPVLSASDIQVVLQ